MIRFAGISTKQSGARFSISFSKQKTKTKYRMNPPPIPSKQPPLFANNFVFEPMPNAENPINVLENLLKHPGRDLWNSCRRAIGRGANVDRTSQARTGHFAGGADLLAEPLHFHLPWRD